MSELNLSKHDHILMGFFSSLQFAAMQHMGKVQNPMSGEIERDMEAARSTIDILDMLKVKCRTDTPDELVRFMDNAVMELQMNFLDEKKKDAGEPTETPDAEKAEAETPATENQKTEQKDEAGE